MRYIRFFWVCILLIIFSKIWFMWYDFSYTTKANFYMGKSGVLAILEALADGLLLFFGSVGLLIGTLKNKPLRSKMFNHFLIGIFLVFVFFFLGNLVWRHSLNFN